MSVPGSFVPSEPHHTVFFIFVVLEAVHEARLRALEGVIPTQNAFQGFENKATELLGGTEECLPDKGVPS